MQIVCCTYVQLRGGRGWIRAEWGLSSERSDLTSNPPSSLEGDDRPWGRWHQGSHACRLHIGSRQKLARKLQPLSSGDRSRTLMRKQITSKCLTHISRAFVCPPPPTPPFRHSLRLYLFHRFVSWLLGSIGPVPGHNDRQWEGRKRGEER